MVIVKNGRPLVHLTAVFAAFLYLLKGFLTAEEITALTDNSIKDFPQYGTMAHDH